MRILVLVGRIISEVVYSVKQITEMGIILKQTWTMSGTFLNLISCGFHLGYPTILIRDLKKPDSEIKLSVEAESWFVSAMAISSIPSTLLIAPVLQIWGRKTAHILIVLPNLIACLILYFAQDVTTLVIARLICGVTFGSKIFVIAVIVGEYSSPEYRGVFLNAKAVNFTLGILMVHLLGIFFDWRITALSGIIPSLFALLNTLTWVESPAWLAYKGRYEECKSSFKWLRGNNDKATEELLLLIQTQRKQQIRKIENNSTIHRFKQNLVKLGQKDFLKPSLIVFFIFVIIESCGRHSFSSYAIKFMSAFTGDNSSTLHYVLALDIFAFISSLCSCGIVKCFRRRTIIFTSGALACVVLISISVYLYLKSQSLAFANNVWFPLTLLFLYYIVINVGLCTNSLSLLGEVYPLEHRGAGTVVSGMLFALSLLVTLKVTPGMIRTMDVHGTFLLFTFCLAVSLLYLYFYLPETEGKTLQEIEHHFNGVSLTLEDDNVRNLLDFKN